MFRISIIILILFSLFFGSCFAESGSEMVLVVLDNKTVQISIESGEPVDANTRSVIETDEVKGIYRNQMIDIFGEIDDFSITASPTLRLSFRSDLVVSEGNGYIIHETDFSGAMDEIAMLRLELPPGYDYVNSSIEPPDIQGNSLTWENVGKIPRVTFKKEPTVTFEEENGTSMNKILKIMGLVLISGILVVAGKKMLS